jgi:hypothetical protein
MYDDCHYLRRAVTSYIENLGGLMIPSVNKLFFTSACLAFGISLGAKAADSTSDTGGAQRIVEQSSIDKLVANQPAVPAASKSDAGSDKPMTINFSDFVKDGAGCGVPNLDTSSK